MAAMGYLRCAHESSGSKSNMAVNSLSSPRFEIDTLPEEPLVKILLRVPREDVGRCKCVCKRWFDLLSSPYFARCYNRHRFSLRPRFGLFVQCKATGYGPVLVNQRGVHLANEEEAHTDFNSPRFSFSFIPTPFNNHHRLLASSNGLVLLCSDSPFNYLVSNPYTMQYWDDLPPPPSRHRRVSIGFICNPDFDINGTTSLFTVVQIPEFENKAQLYTSLKLEIFSSETWEWAESVISLPKPVFGSASLCNDAFVCDGMLHWRYVYQDYVLAFDPCKQEANHEARAIQLPKGSCEGASIHLVGESRDRLRYAEFHQGSFRVWELEEDEGSKQWRLVHKIHESEFVWEDEDVVLNIGRYIASRSMPYGWQVAVDRYIDRDYRNSCLGHMHIVAFHPFEEDYVFLRLPGHIIECNLRSRVLKSLLSIPHYAAAELPYTVFPYVLPWWPLQLQIQGE